MPQKRKNGYKKGCRLGIRLCNGHGAGKGFPDEDPVRLLLFFVLSHFVAFRAVFLDGHTFRMLFLVTGTDVVFIAANRALESDTISHAVSSLHSCRL